MKKNILLKLSIVVAFGCIFCSCSHKVPKKVKPVTMPTQYESSSHNDVTEQSTEENTIPAPVNTSISLTLAGDCTLGTDDLYISSPSTFYGVYNSVGCNTDYFLQNVRDIFSEDDLTLVNLECAITENGERVDGKRFCFRGLPAYTAILSNSSVEAVSFSNNHCKDYGEIGYQDTMVHLQNSNILYSSEDKVCVTNIKGVDIGMISIQSSFRSGDTDADAEYEDTEFLKQITKEYIDTVKSQGAKLVIINYHWGIELSATPSVQQQELGHFAVDCGANIVVGCHSHCIQPIEKYNDAYILYSLGNFCFGGNENPSDKDTFIFRQVFNFVDGELVPDTLVKVIPCSISSAPDYNNYQPTPATGDEHTRILNRINEACSPYGLSFD